MRRGVWLIWLCLALLPLRGMAHATMMAAGAVHGAAAVQAAASPPCPMHLALADGTPSAPNPATSSATADVQSTTCCHLCALCHSAALPVAMRAGPQGAAPDAAPIAVALLGAGRLAPDGLFRPPR